MALRKMLLDEVDEDIFPRKKRKIYVRRNYFIKIESNKEFEMRFRLSKDAVQYLLYQIKEQLEFETDRNDPVAPMNQLLLTLRYYATGSFYLALGDFAGVSTSSAHRIVRRVSIAIANLRSRYILFPAFKEELKISKAEFQEISLFPKVIGAIASTHIKIKNPGGDDAEKYMNKKHYFSLIVQTISNVNLEITDLVARWPGSAQNATIFNASYRRACFEHGQYPDCILLGDRSYPGTSYLFTPLVLNNRSPPAHKLYNKCHERTRNVIDRCVEAWKRRFPILALGFSCKIENALPVITATAVIHNILRRRNDLLPPDDPDLLLPTSWQQLLELGDVAMPVDLADANNECRQKIIDKYFDK